MLKVVFINGEPRCPCGSSKFDTTFELISAGNWKVESLYCYECGGEVEVTEEFTAFLKGEKWTVKQ